MFDSLWLGERTGTQIWSERAAGSDVWARCICTGNVAACLVTVALLPFNGSAAPTLYKTEGLLTPSLSVSSEPMTAGHIWPGLGRGGRIQWLRGSTHLDLGLRSEAHVGKVQCPLHTCTLPTLPSSWSALRASALQPPGLGWLRWVLSAVMPLTLPCSISRPSGQPLHAPDRPLSQTQSPFTCLVVTF